MAETKLGKDAVTLPVGTTAQRPSNPEAGMIRFNTDRGFVEWYDPITDIWTSVAFDGGIVATGGTVTDIEQDGQLFRVHTFTSSGTFEVTRGGVVDCLIVAGGGGGGGSWRHSGDGGGGAGGVLEGNINVSPRQYQVVVGSGGEGGNQTFGSDRPEGEGGYYRAMPGGPSQFGENLIADGGGYGGSRLNNSTADARGEDGGSGGGAGKGSSHTNVGGTGSPGQGHDGGATLGQSSVASDRAGAGGGGASDPGGDGDTNAAGNGGDGVSSTITGQLVYYGGGGGGGHASSVTSNDDPRLGSGGLGGGGQGNAGNFDSVSVSHGAANTGGGGGGAGGDHQQDGNHGGNGGTGIVIVRYRIG